MLHAILKTETFHNWRVRSTISFVSAGGFPVPETSRCPTSSLFGPTMAVKVGDCQCPLNRDPPLRTAAHYLSDKFSLSITDHCPFQAAVCTWSLLAQKHTISKTLRLVLLPKSKSRRPARRAAYPQFDPPTKTLLHPKAICSASMIHQHAVCTSRRNFAVIVDNLASLTDCAAVSSK